MTVFRLRAGGADPDQSGVVSVSYTGDDGSSSSTECSTSDACAPIPTHRTGQLTSTETVSWLTSTKPPGMSNWRTEPSVR